MLIYWEDERHLKINANLIVMSVEVTLENGEKQKISLDIFNQIEFLTAIQRIGLKDYEASIEKYRKELPKLSTKELKQRFIQFGEKAKKMHEEIFERSSPSPIRGLRNYSYSPDYKPDQEIIDTYAEKYKEWMMIDSESFVLEELLKKRKGKDVIKKDAELSKAEERGKMFKRELDETILYFGWN
jgi:hypothetical protein